MAQVSVSSGMEELQQYRQRLVDRLAGVAQRYRAAVLESSLPSSQSNAVSRIISHVRDAAERLFLPGIERILSEENPLLDDLDERLLGEDRQLSGVPLEQIVGELENLQVRLIAVLERMPADSWSRLGRHSEWGLRTLQWWVERSLAHAEAHLAQLSPPNHP